MTSISNQGITLDIVSWTFFLIALIVCCFRFYADYLRPCGPRLDTYISFVTLLIAIASQAFTTLSVYHGMGQHLSSLNPVQITYSLQWGWMAQMLQVVANTTGKIAVVIYIREILERAYTKPQCIFLWTIGVLQVTTIIILEILILTQCSPVAKLWNEALLGSCNGRVRNKHFALFHGSLSVFTDVCLAMYPMGILMRLKMNRNRKALLCILFGFGLLAAGCAITKTCNLNRIAKTEDITYELVQLIIWNAVEMYAVIIAGSIPPSFAFFRINKCRNTIHNAGDNLNLTSASMPPGQTKSGPARNTAMQITDDDSVVELGTENGRGHLSMPGKNTLGEAF